MLRDIDDTFVPGRNFFGTEQLSGFGIEIIGHARKRLSSGQEGAEVAFMISAGIVFVSVDFKPARDHMPRFVKVIQTSADFLEASGENSFVGL